MSELDDKVWAIVSERGIEGSSLSYSDAMRLRRMLEADRINGLCLVTDEAAEREAHQITLRTALSPKS